jgi:ATP-dependent Zn protease
MHSYVSECYAISKDIVQKNKSLIEKLSVSLLDKEYLTREEFESLMKEYISK